MELIQSNVVQSALKSFHTYKWAEKKKVKEIRSHLLVILT